MLEEGLISFNLHQVTSFLTLFSSTAANALLEYQKNYLCLSTSCAVTTLVILSGDILWFPLLPCPAVVELREEKSQLPS
jgi:hypothetical protein